MPTPLVHLVVVPHTHWDREWYQPFEDFRGRLVHLIDTVLDLLEGDPTFAHFHLDGQTIVLEDYLEIRPHQRARLRRLIGAGRIAVGPWYVLPDEFLVSGESLIRNLQIGQRLAAGFGAAPAIGYLPDQFGHVAQMPQILAGLNIDSAVVWRGVGATVTRTLFSWEGLDGSRLFTVYMPATGYSNGRSLPTEPDALRHRLMQIVGEQSSFRAVRSLLVMGGTDHQEPNPRLPEALQAATSTLTELSYEIAPLARFVERARAECTTVEVHRGELRSPLRAHLLPGVTSMRVRQKQRDFENTSRLERYAEPLATWADQLAGTRALTDFTDWAWKLALQNHPHDSICGCSVDAVHRDMDYRFDQVQRVGQRVVRQALRALTQRLDTSLATPDAALVVYNPGGAGPGVVRAELPLDASTAYSLEDAAGRAVPLHVEAADREILLARQLSPDEACRYARTLESRDRMGLVINNVTFRRDAQTLTVAMEMDRVLRGHLDVAEVRTQWLAWLEDSTVRTVSLRVHRRVPSRVTFRAPHLTGCGLTVLALRRQPLTSSPQLIATARTVENEAVRLTLLDDGCLRATDKRTGLVLSRCNWFVDEGDRGDEYNFDPLAEPQAVSRPGATPVVTVDTSNPAVKSLRIDQVYELPRALEADRDTRAAERVAVTIRTVVRLYAGEPRIDFETTVDNTAADHRLRVHFETPLTVRSAFMEQAFGVVERPLPLEAAGDIERPIGTVPQKTFTCIEDGTYGVAVFNRGIQEVEVRPVATGTEIALTLIRAVGWLSRGDLRFRRGHAGPGLETPEAQSAGAHRFEYALLMYGGDWQAAGIVARAHQFAYPPTAVVVDAHPGPLPPDAALVRCDNPHVVVSAITPAQRSGAYLVRCYNASPASQSAAVEFPQGGGVRAVNLLEQPVPGVLQRRRDGTVRLQLHPFQMVTLRVSASRRTPAPPAAAARP